MSQTMENYGKLETMDTSRSSNNEFHKSVSEVKAQETQTWKVKVEVKKPKRR